MVTSNVGEYGPESIRLNGEKIDKLPIAESVNAASQMPAVYATDTLNKINNIKASYPEGSVKSWEAQRLECRTNIGRINTMRNSLSGQINEYSGLIAMCKLRDKELDAANSDDKKKAIRKRYPPYVVEAMDAQIKQFREGIARCDAVMEQDQNSIAELTERIVLCKERDKKLKELGAKVE